MRCLILVCLRKSEPASTVIDVFEAVKDSCYLKLCQICSCDPWCFSHLYLFIYIMLFVLSSSWFFEVLGYPKTSGPNMANGVAMALVFFMVRIAVMPVYYSRMCAVYGTEAFYLVPWGGRVAWICSSICLDIMNIMWMHKITRGCYKVLRSAHRSKKVSAPQENGKTD